MIGQESVLAVRIHEGSMFRAYAFESLLLQEWAGNTLHPFTIGSATAMRCVNQKAIEVSDYNTLVKHF